MRLRILATIAIDPLFEIIRTIEAIKSCTSPRSHFGTSSVPPPTTMGADPASAFFFWRYIAIHIQQEGSLSPSPLWVHPKVVPIFLGAFGHVKETGLPLQYSRCCVWTCDGNWAAAPIFCGLSIVVERCVVRRGFFFELVCGTMKSISVFCKNTTMCVAQKKKCPLHSYGKHGRRALPLVVDTGRAKLVLLVAMPSRGILFDCRQAQDAQMRMFIAVLWLRHCGPREREWQLLSGRHNFILPSTQWSPCKLAEDLCRRAGCSVQTTRAPRVRQKGRETGEPECPFSTLGFLLKPSTLGLGTPETSAYWAMPHPR